MTYVCVLFRSQEAQKLIYSKVYLEVWRQRIRIREVEKGSIKDVSIMDIWF